MSILKLTPPELKAMRQGLGLTVAEAAELKAINVSKRAFQYWEAGDRPIPDDVSQTFYAIACQYHAIVKVLNEDIARFKEQNPLPDTDDANEYFEQIKQVKKLVLPFYTSFVDFVEATGNSHVIHWRLWQSAISHLFLIGKLNDLDDNVSVPNDFKAWSWLNGDYGVDDLAD
ncbi:DUF1870 family protein [Psychrobacter pygoscelis]|uniref:Aca2/YdiL-like domain-containing protein n=1 Tax=Psychrobacter pygoscelis TaxID=2488563 RepID=UPI00103C75BD|nr:DUF1870 family protein [Psychrobacter pygoscelis]